MIYVVIILLSVILTFLIFASYSIQAGIYIKSLCNIETEEHVVMLTFDDGPDDINTPKVLDVLKNHGAKALFFLIGDNAQKNPQIVKRIVDEGHIIGLHTMHHNATFPMKGTESVIDEIEENCKVIKNITGVPPTLFRPPFGVTNPHIAKAVKKLQLVSVGWSIRSYDTNIKISRDKVAMRIIDKIHPGAIILMHDDRFGSDTLVDTVLMKLGEKGYRTSIFL